MGFKVFDAYGAASRPTATLRVSGYMFLSKSIQKQAGSEHPTHVQLSFDEDSDKVGIRFLTDFVDDTDSPSIREVSTEKSGISANLLPLLRFYRFSKPTKKHVFPVEFEDGMVVVDLSELRPKSIELEEL